MKKKPKMPVTGDDGVFRYKPDPNPQPFALPLRFFPKNVLAAIQKDCPEDLKTLEADGFFSIPITIGNVVKKPLKDELLDRADRAGKIAKQYEKLARMLRDPRLAFSFDRSAPDEAEIEHLERKAREFKFASDGNREPLRRYPNYPSNANQRVHHLVAEVLKHKPDFSHWEEVARVTWVALEALGIDVNSIKKNLSAEAMKAEAVKIRKQERT